MEEKVSSWLGLAPNWVWLSATAFLGLGVGFFFAKQIWGRNRKRLKAALDDSSYLAGQWATMGLSQSQLVEKLGRKVCASLSEFGAKEAALKGEISRLQVLVEEGRRSLQEVKENGTELSKREVEALQLQGAEIEKRDHRIKTLEARIKYLDEVGDSSMEEHQKQVRALLDRIDLLESGSGLPDPELAQSNRELSELLEERCEELEGLRDEFYAKEKEFNHLREQNSVLKKNVDKIVAGWSEKKGQDAQLAKTQIRLGEVEASFAQLRNDYENQTLEMELLRTQSEMELEATANPEDSEQTGAQIDILLDIIENRDLRVDELERQLTSGNKGDQILALTQTIADLQMRLSKAENSLVKQPSNRIVTEAKAAAAAIGGKRRISINNPGSKSNIYFGEHSSHIKEEHIQALEEIAKEVLKTRCQISLAGYGLGEGDAEFHGAISLRRAEAVREFFENQGINSDQVIVKGRGEDQNITGQSDEWQGRRVEIVLLPVAEIVN